jgi:hypothetical protein
MEMMRPDRSLDTLEAEVLSRIAAYRKVPKVSGALPVALLLAFTALASGVLTGIAEPHHRLSRQGSEAVLLADDLSLAPSSLLASNQ